MISSRSRYVDGHVVPEPDATVMVTRVFPTNPGVVAGKSYIWVQGDRLDRLAARWLGSPLLWWKIAAAGRPKNCSTGIRTLVFCICSFSAAPLQRQSALAPR